MFSLPKEKIRNLQVNSINIPNKLTNNAIEKILVSAFSTCFLEKNKIIKVTEKIRVLSKKKEYSIYNTTNYILL